MCPKDYFIAAAQVKNMDYKGAGRSLGDDEGITGLSFRCVEYDGSDEEVITYWGHGEGEWKNWSTSYDDKYVYKI